MLTASNTFDINLVVFLKLYLEESKKTAEAEQSDKKKKAVSVQVEEMKKKKARLQQDISSLEASEDTLLTKAETKHATKYVTGANSLHHTVKEEEAQLMLTTGSTRLAVSRGQQTWYHSTCNI